tara:strand:- start:82 stop:369 length:288 start_codon:yes stop_codon:yes gene_type:complete
VEVHHFVKNEICVGVKSRLNLLALIVEVALDIETVFEAEWFYGVVAVTVESSIELFAASIVNHRYSPGICQASVWALSEWRVVIVAALVCRIIKN